MSVPEAEQEQYMKGLRAEKARLEAEIARLNSNKPLRENHDVPLDQEVAKLQEMLVELRTELETDGASIDAAYTRTGFDRQPE